MLGYVTLGTNDRDKAAAFYDELLGSIDFGRIFEDEKLIIWGKSMDEGAVGVTTPFNDEPAPSCGLAVVGAGAGGLYTALR